MRGTVYTYAVARPFDPAPLAGLRGIDGAPIRLLRDRELVAVVSTLRAAALRARLRSLEELEGVARAHHAVVEAVAALSVTLPLRLATLHRGNAGVAATLREEYEGLCARLDRLAGRVELGVKVHRRAEEASAADAGPPKASLPSSGAGRDYLRRLHRQRLEREEGRHRADAAVRRVDAALAELAVDRHHHRPQAPPLSPAGRENVLNAAYLVERGRVEEFIARARELAERMPEVSVEVTGPWAPYSFIDAPSSASRAAGGDVAGRT